MNQSDIGLVGLAVMGENLVLNMESKGFRVSVFNRTTAVTENSPRGEPRQEHRSYQGSRGFCPIPARPRKAQIMVKAGAPVDAVIDQPRAAT
jgi:6-phosphogluconate dehydrogenase